MTLDEKITVRRAAATEYINTLNTREKFVDAMRAINIAWGDVRDPATIMEQPTVESRGSIVEIDDRAGGTRPVTQSPYRFSNAKSGVKGPAAHRGEHNAEVLHEWLNLSDAEVETIMSSDAVVAFDPDWRHH